MKNNGCKAPIGGSHDASQGPPAASATSEAIVEITQVINRWAIARDSGDWNTLLDSWHTGGQIVSTWRQSDAETFVQGCISAWERGIDVIHTLSGTAIEVRDDRGIAQTRMAISQRSRLGQTLVDVTCFGRFYDFFERRAGRWKIVLRQPIYERDRIDPIIPGEIVDLDEELLSTFPSGYRHLGYVQTRSGLSVKRDLPGARGAAVERLYEAGRSWITGGPFSEILDQDSYQNG